MPSVHWTLATAVDPFNNEQLCGPFLDQLDVEIARMTKRLVDQALNRGFLSSLLEWSIIFLTVALLLFAPRFFTMGTGFNAVLAVVALSSTSCRIGSEILRDVGFGDDFPWTIWGKCPLS